MSRRLAREVVLQSLFQIDFTACEAEQALNSSMAEHDEFIYLNDAEAETVKLSFNVPQELIMTSDEDDYEKYLDNAVFVVGIGNNEIRKRIFCENTLFPGLWLLVEQIFISQIIRAFLFAVFAAVNRFCFICETEDMREFLLDGSDTTGIFTLINILYFFRK